MVSLTWKDLALFRVGRKNFRSTGPAIAMLQLLSGFLVGRLSSWVPLQQLLGRRGLCLMGGAVLCLSPTWTLLKMLDLLGGMKVGACHVYEEVSQKLACEEEKGTIRETAEFFKKSLEDARKAFKAKDYSLKIPAGCVLFAILVAGCWIWKQPPRRRRGWFRWWVGVLAWNLLPKQATLAITSFIDRPKWATFHGEEHAIGLSCWLIVMFEEWVFVTAHGTSGMKTPKSWT